LNEKEEGGGKLMHWEKVEEAEREGFHSRELEAVREGRKNLRK